MTVTGTYTGSGGGQVDLSSGGLTIGAAGAAFDFPQGFFQWTGGLIEGSGTLTDGPAGFITVAPPTGNSLSVEDAGLALADGGTLDVASGTLTLEGGSMTDTSGSITVAQGTTLDLTGGATEVYSGAFTATGGGTIALSGGELSIAIGGASFNFPGGMFQWSNGSIDSSLGDLTNLGTINVVGSDEKRFIDDGTLDDFGSIIQTGQGNLGLHGGNQFPTTLMIEEGASYLIEADSGLDNPNGGETAVINAGTIEKTAGTGTSTILVYGTLSNTGTIEAESGTLALSATIAQDSSGALTAGTWSAVDGSTLAFPSGTSFTSRASAHFKQSWQSGVLAP